MELWWRQKRPRQLEARPRLAHDLEHVWIGYHELETERPWVVVPMGAPFQGPVPWSKKEFWFDRRGVAKEDRPVYEQLWACIAEELAQGK